MARPGRQERNRTARSFRQLTRFHHGINSDEVFGTHRLLYCLSVQREVEAFALRVLRHAEADKHLDHGEDDQAGDGIIDEDGGDPDALIEELTHVALQNACRSAVLFDREYPGEQRPDDPANRMYTETIERIVVAEHALQPGAPPVAEDAR